MGRAANRREIQQFRDEADAMRVRLVRKFSEVIDDIDLSRARIGDVLTLTLREGLLLVAEGWAVPHIARPWPTRRIV